jgi:hypothetical protein
LKPQNYLTISNKNFASNAELVMDFKERSFVNKIRFIVLETMEAKKKGICIPEIIFARDIWLNQE